MALSVKLGMWEASLNRYVESIEFVIEVRSGFVSCHKLVYAMISVGSALRLDILSAVFPRVEVFCVGTLCHWASGRQCFAWSYFASNQMTQHYIAEDVMLLCKMCLPSDNGTWSFNTNNSVAQCWSYSWASSVPTTLFFEIHLSGFIRHVTVDVFLCGNLYFI